MGRKTKLGKGRLDKYYHLAKEQGYRSRAAFKLVQLNKKYNFLPPARALLDLCAAPGGWLQVASKYMPVSSIIIGVDLVPIKPIRNCITITDDITTESCRQKIKKELKTWSVDVVTHDGAPNVGKAWIQDAFSQSELTLHALRLATDFLAAGGTFVTKVFRSAEYNSLLYVFNQLFRRVEATKPSASRSTSAEIYVICRGYLAPKKIDPRLLDPRFAFQEIEKHVSSATALFKKREKPNQSGYREGPVFRQLSLADFVASASPVMALAENFTIVADAPNDEASRQLAAQPEFTGDLREMCKDLQVLNKHEFRKLLKFRERMRKRFPSEEEKQRELEAEQAKLKLQQERDRKLTPEEEEEELEQQLEAKLQAKSKLDRRQRRRRNKMRTRAHNRLTMEMEHRISTNEISTSIDKNDLFGLLEIPNEELLEQTLTGDMPADMGNDGVDMGSDDSDSDSDNDDPLADERDKYLKRLEKDTDRQYREYCERRGKILREAAPAGMRLKPKKPEEVDVWSAVEGSLHDEEQLEKSATTDFESNNPLIVKRETMAPEDTAGTLQSWFSQSLFQQLLNPSSVLTGPQPIKARPGAKIDFPQRRQTDDEARRRAIKELERDTDSDSSDSGDERQKQKELRRKKRERELARETFAIVPLSSDDDDDDDEGGENPYDAAAASTARSGSSSRAERKRGKQSSDSSSDDDELDVPGEDDRADTESEDEYEYEVEAAQYVLAYAKNIIRQKGKIDPSKIVDDSYNRWALPDNEQRPSWFAVDTSEHEKPILPVTRADMEEMKLRAKAVDARPIKKIAEAQARKRRRMQQKVAKLKEKAKQIASQGDLSDRDKLRAVQRLVARQLKTKKVEKFYVVRSKHHVGQRLPKAPGGSRLHLVDKRMKKEKVARARREKKKTTKRSRKN